MNKEIYKQISRTRGEDAAQAYRLSRIGAERKAVDELKASRTHLREALSGEIADGASPTSSGGMSELPKDVQTGPLVVPIAELAPKLSQFATS